MTQPLRQLTRDELLHQLAHVEHVDYEMAREMVRAADRKGVYTEPFRFTITKLHSTGGMFTLSRKGQEGYAGG